MALSTSSTVTSKKKISSEDKEREIISRYKKKEQWYGYPKTWWIGGGFLLTLVLCVYLASKLYGRSSNTKDNNQNMQQGSGQEPTSLYPPMPAGVTPYVPQQRTGAVSSHIENMNKRDLLNSIPVNSSHLAQFESRFTQTPKRPEPPQEESNQVPIRQQSINNNPHNTGTASGFEAQTRTDKYAYPNNKEGGGEGTPLPPVDYSQFEQEDAF